MIYDSIEQIKQLEGFVFHSFSSPNNCFISNLNSIKTKDFIFYNSIEKPHITKKNEYFEACNNIIELLKSKKVDKVVLSRVKKVQLHKHPLEIFEALNHNYKATFNYLISIENIGTWIGATPELLIDIKENKLKTVSLAGTKLLNNTSWSKKELREQDIVTQFITNQLTPFTNNIQKNGPFTIHTGAVYHLKTKIEATLKTEDLWINVIKALHPTPATCGLPKLKAIDVISKHEPHKRLFYTGFLGPINQSEKRLMVNLRCMQIINNEGFLYLGGGLTSESNVDDEWEETENKAKTLLKVMD